MARGSGVEAGVADSVLVMEVKPVVAAASCLLPIISG